jgi:hypothetical protein
MMAFRASVVSGPMVETLPKTLVEEINFMQWQISFSKKTISLKVIGEDFCPEPTTPLELSDFPLVLTSVSEYHFLVTST